MGFLGKPHGIFSLNNSDYSIGSYISIDDICEILDVNQSDLTNIKFEKISDKLYADEIVVHKAWHNGVIRNAPNVNVNTFKTSLDELILIKIIKKIYPEANIEHQVQWGKKSIDLKVTVNLDFGQK